MLNLFKLGFFLLPLIEIAGFIIVGRLIGVFPTLLLIILTSILGATILRSQGLRQLGQIKRRVTEGKRTEINVLDTACLLLAGFLLLLPGFLTDIIGLSLLIHPLRTWLLGLLSKKGIIQTSKTSKTSHDKQHHIIEGKYWKDDDDKK